VGEYTRDVFISRDAARLAALDAITRHYPDTLTTARQLGALAVILADGYLASERLVSLDEFAAGVLARSMRTLSLSEGVALLTSAGT
jgi:hypothetical protein